MRGWWSSWYTQKHTHGDTHTHTDWPIREYSYTHEPACVFSATAHWLSPQTTGSLCYSRSLVVTSTGDTHMHTHIYKHSPPALHMEIYHTHLNVNPLIQFAVLCLMHAMLGALKWNHMQLSSSRSAKSLSKGGWVMPVLGAQSRTCGCFITRCSVTGLGGTSWQTRTQTYVLFHTNTHTRTDRLDVTMVWEQKRLGK